jgi:hypothetical protein
VRSGSGRAVRGPGNGTSLVSDSAKLSLVVSIAAHTFAWAADTAYRRIDQGLDRCGEKPSARPWVQSNRPSGGPASTYPTLSGPASICFRGPNEVLFDTTGQRTLAIAAWITSVTICGCEIMITCDPASSVISAPARFAMERTTSVPAALSPVATTRTIGEGAVHKHDGHRAIRRCCLRHGHSCFSHPNNRAA